MGDEITSDYPRICGKPGCSHTATTGSEFCALHADYRPDARPTEALQEAKDALARAQELSGPPTVAQLYWVIAHAAIAQAEAAERQATALERIADALYADNVFDTSNTYSIAQLVYALQRIAANTQPGSVAS